MKGLAMQRVFIKHEKILRSENWVGSYAEAIEASERDLLSNPDLRIDIVDDMGNTLWSKTAYR